MIDLRYLALTLIGVFLALAIGLMTGSALGGPDKRDAAYEGLRDQFELLRTENQRVQTENDAVLRRISAHDQAIRELMPLAVRDRLPGSVVGVVVCGGLDERRFWGELETALRLAGAEIGPVAHVPDRLRSLSGEARQRFAAVWDADFSTDETHPFEAAGWLVTALSRGDAAQRLEELCRQTGMTVRGDIRRPLRRILILTGAPNEERATAVAAGDVPDVRIVDAALSAGLRAVVAEPEASMPSAVDQPGRRGVPTVDNVDTAAGQLSVVLALAGADGRFGSKTGASRPIPSLERP